MTSMPRKTPAHTHPARTIAARTIAARTTGLPDPSGVLTLDLGEGPRAYALFALDELPARLRRRLAQALPAARAAALDAAAAADAQDAAQDTANDAQVDAEDVRDARAAFAVPRAADLPAAALRRLVAGEPPLEVLPEARGLTQKELAARAGLSQAYVSQLAAGSRKGSLKAWRALAAALQVDLELLLPDAA